MFDRGSFQDNQRRNNNLNGSSRPGENDAEGVQLLQTITRLSIMMNTFTNESILTTEMFYKTDAGLK